MLLLTGASASLHLLLNKAQSLAFLTAVKDQLLDTVLGSDTTLVRCWGQISWVHFLHLADFDGVKIFIVHDLRGAIRDASDYAATALLSHY